MVGAATGSSRLNCTPGLKLSNTFDKGALEELFRLPPFTLEARLSAAPLNALDKLLDRLLAEGV